MQNLGCLLGLLPGLVDQLQAVHYIEGILPKFLQGDVGGSGDIKAPMEEELGVEFLEISDDLLVHGLDEWRSVGREELNLDEFIFVKEVLLEAWRVSRRIVLN